MEVFVYDTVTISLDTGIDVSGFSKLNVKYERPDGTTGCWDASLSPTDNNHVIADLDGDDLDMNGIWKVQAYIEEGDEHYHGGVAEFTVYNRLVNTC